MTEVGRNIRETRLKKGLTQRELGERSGIAEPTIRKYELGKLNPKISTLKKIADALDVDVFSIADFDTASAMIENDVNLKATKNPTIEESKNVIIPMDDVSMVPIVGKISAGIPILAQENIVGYQPIPMLSNANEYFCLRVDGDSMVGAGIPDGSVVLIRRQNCADNGNIVACMLNSSDATLKTYKQIGNTVLLISENPKYDPFIVPVSDFENGTARIIGVATQVITSKSLL